MACSKYTLTNTGSTIVNFNYRRCDDSLWEYQVELNPNQTKNIWLIDRTFSVAPVYTTMISLIDQGAFPPISQTATPTPTPSITPSVTPTMTQTSTSSATPTPTNTETSTPTNTPTNTETPTNTPTNTGTPTETPTQTPTPTSPLQVFNVFSGVTSNEACENGVATTIYAFNPSFDENSQFYNDASGVVIGDISGFYSNGVSVNELNSDGLILGSFTSCGVLETVTPTPTNTETPTPTPTMTQTPTQTFAWYTYTLGSGITTNEACESFTTSPITVYGSVEGGVGPNIGEYLYETAGIPLTDTAPDGYYSNGVATFQVTGGLGEVTYINPNGCI